ncbi:hypothetical protein TrST_g6770 [Triparma strigata]|uniref:Nucleotide-diphospho-sugar transferase domain-containing protein n=1 Tax=Triparma strigata TaxID=1606541 RepID=A0A9W7EZ81_9STRA|nr:hypothetical protein TrST_g6770 [Triparma strigata]
MKLKLSFLKLLNTWRNLRTVTRLTLILSIPYVILTSYYFFNYKAREPYLDRWNPSQSQIGRIPENVDHRYSYTWLRSSSPLPVTIVTVQSDLSHYWCTCGYKSLEKYAEMWGYTILHSSIPSTVVSSKLKKYELALSTLSSSSLTVILDCDIFITNPTIPIQRIWDEYAHTETEVLLSRDAHWRMGVPVNSGVVILKGGEFSRNLLSNIIKKDRVKTGPYSTKFNAETLVDQPRLTVELLLSSQLSDPPLHEYEINSKVTVVSQRVINSFYRYPQSYFSGFHYDPSNSKWRKGDLLAHITGMDVEEMIEAADRFGEGCEGVERMETKVTTDGVRGVGGN